MPIGYLVTLALIAVGTALSLVPLRRPRSVAMLNFGTTLVVNEIPLLVLAWLAAWTLVEAGQDNLASPAGGAALGVCVMTAVGLVVLARRGLRARTVVERAVHASLGTQPGGIGSSSRWRAVRSLLWPFPVRPREVERLANIAYGDAGRHHRLDVYRHRSRPSGAPVLVYLHGGGYFSGGKHHEARALLHRFARQGWVCVSANYRLRPAAGFLDHLVDAKRVIAWVREHGHEYGADPSVLVLSGSSAGAHLTALCALTPGEPGLQPGFEGADTSVTAAVCLYGYFGYYYEEAVPSSPLAYVGPHAPPFFVAHGDNDTYVPVRGAREFVDRLRAASAEPVVYAELPGAQHAFDLFASPRFEAVLGGIETFTAWVRSRSDAADTARPDRVS